MCLVSGQFKEPSQLPVFALLFFCTDAVLCNLVPDGWQVGPEPHLVGLPELLVQQLAKHVGRLAREVVGPWLAFGGFHFFNERRAGRNLEAELLIKLSGGKLPLSPAILAGTQLSAGKLLELLQDLERALRFLLCFARQRLLKDIFLRSRFLRLELHDRVEMSRSQERGSADLGNRLL